MRVPVRREPPDERGSEFARLRDRLLADLERWPDLVAKSRRARRPDAALEETSDAYLVDVDLPGVPPADASVEVVGGRLTVTGRRPGRHHVQPERSGTAVRFVLELTLPPDADPSGLTAELDLGVLHLRLPRRSDSGGRRIPVRRPAAEPSDG